jgi:hypothetical protein
MKSSSRSWRLYSVLVSICALSLAAFPNRARLAPQEKTSTQELIAKHLEAIGTAEARAALKSITIVGQTKATFRGRGTGLAEGIVVLASEGNKNLIGMKFNNPDYPFEKMGYDGDDLSVGFVRPGVRSVLGDFLRLNENSFKRGVIGGVLSTAWPLLHLDDKLSEVKYSGMKTINGRKLHELKFSPRKGSDLRISMFFDPDNFRHLRTEYKRVLAAHLGATVDTSAQQSETRYTMIEEFSDYSQENELTLPHTYKLYLEIITGNGTTSYEWTMTLQQEIDPKDFKVDSY